MGYVLTELQHESRSSALALSHTVQEGDYWLSYTVYLHGLFCVVMQKFCKFLQEGVMLRKIVHPPEPCKEQSRTGRHSAMTYKNILERFISYVVTLV